MDSILMQGGVKLQGSINISGAKNGSLPIMAASILINKLTLHNVPDLADVRTMIEILRNHGAKVSFSDNTLEIDSRAINNFEAPYDMVRKMRASIWVLAPLVAKYKEARVSMPGGCTLGARQIDLHIDGLKKLGAQIDFDHGYINGFSPEGALRGASFHFDKISVGATITMIIAAVTAQGETCLTNCAIEPEVVDLCNFLAKAGAIIEGIGTQKLIIKGVKKLNDIEYSVIPDRIEAGTYIIAAGITAGDLLLKNIDYGLISNICAYLEKTGLRFNFDPRNRSLRVRSPEKILPANIETHPFPGFPTDLQAQYMALMTIAEGESIIQENIFENRLMHVQELCRMRANIKIMNHNIAIVNGVKKLQSAQVMSSDLRASVALVLAGLAAEGATYIKRIYHLDRGYERLDEKLNACGASIRRVKDVAI